MKHFCIENLHKTINETHIKNVFGFANLWKSFSLTNTIQPHGGTNTDLHIRNTVDFPHIFFVIFIAEDDKHIHTHILSNVKSSARFAHLQITM